MRLTGVDIRLKPLRERFDELDDFVSLFIDQKQIEIDLHEKNEIISCLKDQSWPGNIRQLFKVLQVATFNASLNSERLNVSHLPKEQLNRSPAMTNYEISSDENLILEALREDRPFKQSVEFFEKLVLEVAIKRHKSISDVCRKLGMGRSSLDSKRIKYDLD